VLLRMNVQADVRFLQVDGLRRHELRNRASGLGALHGTFLSSVQEPHPGSRPSYPPSIRSVRSAPSATEACRSHLPCCCPCSSAHHVRGEGGVPEDLLATLPLARLGSRLVEVHAQRPGGAYLRSHSRYLRSAYCAAGR